MNLILLTKDDFLASGSSALRVRVSGRRHEHAARILKSSVGDELRVGLLNGRIGKGCVTAIDGSALEMDVELSIKPPAPIDLELVLALPRPIVLKRLFSHVAAFGVKRIALINSERVEQSYWKSPALAQKKIDEQLMLGLEQAGDTVMPEVRMHPRFKPFVEDELPAMANAARAFVAHPDAEASCPCCVEGPAVLIVGPEGGFVPYELDKLKAAGCSGVRLGGRILRVETAVTALIARLKA